MFHFIKGFEQGISQLSKQAENSNYTFSDVSPCVWNFPIDIAFKSTNVFGWPTLLVTVYGYDFLGRDVVRGYGALRLPTVPGKYTKYVPLFAPVASSPFYSFYSWIMGRLPEFIDPKFAAKEEGRECKLLLTLVTRVQSQGSVKIGISIASKDLENCGYIIEKH